MKIILAMCVLLLASTAHAEIDRCYIFSVGEPVLRDGIIYYSVRRVCYQRNGEYKVQESYYTIEAINTENWLR